MAIIVALLPLSPTLIFGLACVLLLPLYYLFVKKEKPKGLPHGSMGWPFLGETLSFLKPHKSNSIGSFLQQHFSRYGKVFKSHLFGCPTIVSGDLELNNFILLNEDKLFQSYYPKSVQDILGKLSLMLVSGELHKKLRTVALGFIANSKSSPDFLLYVENLTISVMDSWKGCQEIQFAKEAKKFTLYVMLKNLLNIEPEEPLASQMLEDYLSYMKGLVSLPLCFPGTTYAKALKARARISRTIREIIEERRKKEGPKRGDFLDEMMDKRSEELNDEERVSIVMDLLFAGYETTAGLLSLLLYYLAQAPEALEQLKQEHQSLTKSKKHGDPLSWQDIQQLNFNSHVVNETLRCGNLVKFVHRRTLQDVNFRGYHIPGGWQVLPVFTAVHLDPSLHDSPSDFNPWRWNDEAINKKVNPFGGGTRLCPGTELAKLEATIFLHHLILKYRWKLKEDNDFPLSYPYLEFSKGLKLEIQPTEDIN